MNTPTTQVATDAAAQSLGRGAAGHALLHIERTRTGRASWATAHEYIIEMTRAPVAAHVESSLFEGAPAVAFVLSVADQAAYEPALATLDRHIDELTRERLRGAHQRIDRGQLPALREFDLISGMTGLGVYQLRRHRGGELLREVLQYLVRLCEPLARGEQCLPGWWTGNDTADHPSEYWPGGHGNLGIAHGISGPLALMASARRLGIQVPGQVDAIKTIGTWLDHWQQGDGAQAWWPGTITMRELNSDTLEQPGPQRPSWCYGTAGIARAQQLAGLALNDQVRRHGAETVLLGCITDNAQLEQLTDPSLCHGLAGLVQATWRAAADAGPASPLATQLVPLMSRLDDLVRTRRSLRYDELLEGTIGVLLTQMTASSSAESASAWDACLLLDG